MWGIVYKQSVEKPFLFICVWNLFIVIKMVAIWKINV